MYNILIVLIILIKSEIRILKMNRVNFNFTTVGMIVKDYILNFNDGKFTLPIWQRGQQDVWTDEYREKLIVSMLEGIDIPKIYIGHILESGKIIIDGGHRSRAIRDYMKNNYSVDLEGERVFYSKDPLSPGIRNRRIMTDNERDILENYCLTITEYKNITEIQSRWIFNQLQNAAPMTMPDIVNSYLSPLVDFMRSQRNLVIRSKTLEHHFKDLKSLPKPDNNEFLYQILSWFTIVNPFENTDISQGEGALKYIEKGKNRNSSCFKYLEEFKGDVTDIMRESFEKEMINLIEFLMDHPELRSSGDVNSFLYANMWIPNFSSSKFSEFIKKIKEFQSLKTESEKKFKSGDVPLASEKQKAKEALNDLYDGKIEEWIRSRQQNPSGEKNMNIRNEIIKVYCTDDPLQDVFAAHAADGPAVVHDVLAAFGAPLKKVKTID